MSNSNKLRHVIFAMVIVFAVSCEDETDTDSGTPVVDSGPGDAGSDAGPGEVDAGTPVPTLVASEVLAGITSDQWDAAERITVTQRTTSLPGSRARPRGPLD